MGKPIHIVDDDVGFLKGIARLLALHGLEVRAFSSAEAFQAQDDIDGAACLILDVNLGSVSGIDLMTELFRSGARIPVILITASNSELTRQAGYASGCSVFLQKPVPAKILLDAIGDATGGARLRSV